MQVITAKQYYDQLIIKIPQASQRIIIAVMVMSAGRHTDKLFDLLRDALGRGVKVHIVLDKWSKLSLAREKGMSSKAFTQIIKCTVLQLEDLQMLGATISWVGTIGPNPFKGRCHIKIAVIDDFIYSFGGVNFNDAAFEHIDFMFTTQDSGQAGVLQTLVQNIAENALLKDCEIMLGTKASLLFDAGQPGVSIIYERACALAAQAKKIYYISQMCPSGRLGMLIRQTDHICYFNRPLQGSIFLTASLVIDMFRSGLRTNYHRNEYLHAKCILFVMKDGSKQLLSGSHNFSWRGVAYGTQEIALHSLDVQLWDSVYTFMKREVVP